MNQDHLLSLDEMWKKAEARFNNRTGIALQSKSVTWLHCIEEIEKMQNSDESPAADDRFEKAKNWGVHIVECLRLVGGVAAKAAGTVFGPSETCFNALAVLLDIPVRIHHFHQAVATMFETLGPALSLYKIYKDKDQFRNVHPEVNRAVHEIMISFVDICGLYQTLHGIESKAKRFWVDFKVALLKDDSGVGAEIENFKRLAQNHRDVQATQTLNEVLRTNQLVANMLLQSTEIQRDVAILRNSDDERTLQEKHQQHLEVVKNKLGWSESASDQSRKIQEKLHNNIPDRTANWFKTEKDCPQFVAWMKGKSIGETQSQPLFILTGPQDTGKSVLMSAILRHLQTISPTKKPLRNLITGYFFPPPPDAKDEDRHPVRTALKCIAMQLAIQDVVFAKRLRKRCEDEPDIDQVIRSETYQRLWDFLGIGTPRDNTIHYVVIDGFASLSNEKEGEEQMKQLFGILGMQLNSKANVRVAISVTSSMMPLMLECLRSPSLVVEIVQKSSDDIKRLINFQLEKNDIFQDGQAAERHGVVDLIAAEVQGDFRKIDTVVEKVDKLVDSYASMEDIRKALDLSSGNSTVSFDAIRRLETELGAKEIKELQELLRWTMFGCQTYWSLDELNGALLLTLGTANKTKMEKKLAARGKYSDIFILDEEQEVRVREDVCEQLRRDKRQLESDGAPKITASFQITKGDITSVQTFCWSLSQQLSQLNFNFDNAALAAGNVRKTFQIHEIDANLSILRSTFSILEEDPVERTQALGRYAVAYLPQHLRGVGNPDELKSEERADIAKRLYRIFESGDVVDRHWDITDSSNVWWHRDDDEVEIIREFLCKPSILEHLGIKDQDWLRNVERDRDPNRALLKPIMKKVASRWLSDTGRSVERPFKWIREHLKMDPSVIPKRGRDNDGTAEDIETAAEWCQDVLGIDKDEDIWFRRLGETFSINNCASKGIEALQMAIEKCGPDSKLLQVLARCYAEEGEYSAACREMTDAKAIMANEEDCDPVILSKVCSDLGTWYSKLGNLDADISNTKEALELDKGNHEARLHLLSTYLDNRLNDEALDFVRECLGDQSGMSKIFIYMMESSGSEDDSMFIKLFSITQGHPEQSQLLEQLGLPGYLATEEAIEKARLCRGVVSYYFCENDPESRNIAINLWKLSSRLDTSSRWQPQCVSLISAHHFEQARASKEPANQAMHVEGMKSMVGHAITNSGLTLAHIATYHSLNNDTLSSRESVRPSVHKAFDLLSDADEKNDDDGFWILATAFMRCRDDVNALSGFCCLAPQHLQDAEWDVVEWLRESDGDDETFRSLVQALIAAARSFEDEELEQEEVDMVLAKIRRHSAEASSGDTNLSISLENSPDTLYGPSVVEICDRLRTAYGRLRESTNHSLWMLECDSCGVIWDFEHAFYCCKYCRCRSLCQPCRARFQDEPFPSNVRYVEDLACQKDHDWLFLPRWTREAYITGLVGKVMTGGYMENEVRVSGELMLVSDWIHLLKQEWGWSKTEVLEEED